MASYTPNLNLYKKDPILDGNDFFNIKTMMNDNWDKIDESVKAALDDIGDLQSEQVRIATGSYVGTGTYGASNPCSLTFDFAPRYIVITTGYTMSSFASTDSWIRPVSSANGMAGSHPCTITWLENGITWYGDYSPDYQINKSGTTYYYLAIG